MVETTVNPRSQLKSEIAEFRREIRSGYSDLLEELRAEIHDAASSVIRHIYAAILCQTAVLLGLAWFYVTHLAG